MAYSIIETMPSIHATLIGFVGAFLCAIGVYALQKIQDATDRFTVLLGKAKIELSPSWCKGDSLGVGLPDGRLDWSEFSRVMHEVSTIACGDESCRKDNSLRVSSEDEIVRAFEELWRFLCHVFIMYPFNGSVDGVTLFEAAEKIKGGKFDLKRIKEMHDRLTKLVWFLSRDDKQILAVARKYTVIMKKRDLESKRAIAAQLRSEWPPLMREEEKDEIEIGILNSPTYLVDAEQAMLEIFKITDEYYNKFLGSLKDTLKVRDQWLRRYPIKSITKWGFIFSCFILFVGVFLPPLIISVQQDLNLCADFGLCWLPWMGYVLYGISALSYFIGAGCLWFKFRSPEDFD